MLITSDLETLFGGLFLLFQLNWQNHIILEYPATDEAPRFSINLPLYQFHYNWREDSRNALQKAFQRNNYIHARSSARSFVDSVSNNPKKYGKLNLLRVI